MCGDCGLLVANTRLRRSFIERHITHKNKYKYYCPKCKRKVFVAIGGNVELKQ